MTRRTLTDEERIASIREVIEAARGDWHEATALRSIGADLNWLLDRAVVREDAPSREGLDVEPGHNHTTSGFPTFPVCREACPLGCDALRAGEIAANTGKRPNLAVVDPFVEAAAMQAVRAAALAATPPGDRHTPECSSRFARDGVTGEAICDCGIEEAAVTTAEAAAGEEG